ncbi:TNF receptor-associated factor 5 [Malaya genurostris]|uniref:TNF receptor-associated factor 5 n=1 Tax=Malaya genurostris TaxID=325434 RepID=UPI0026F3FB0E|nr:TNF receptor-associated factor 5 [Malaya genurostris]
MATARTRVKFNKTSCYFCNEWFENDEIEAHLTVCGQTLGKCPNNCGSYITRRDMDRHLNRCPEGFGEEPRLSNGTDADSVTNELEKIHELEQEILTLRGSLNEEISQRLDLISDIGQLKKRTQLADEWTGKVGDVLNALKKCINEETDSRCVDIERCKIDINGLLKQYKEIESWRLELTSRFNQMEDRMRKVSLVLRQSQQPTAVEETKHKDAKLVMIESRLNHVQSELENLTLRQAPPDEQRKRADGNTADSGQMLAAIEEIESKLQTVDMVLEDHHDSIRIFQQDIKQQVSELRGESDPMRMVIQEMLDKQAKLDYELKGVLNTVNETEDASDRTQKTLEKYRRETYYTKQCLDDLQVHLQHQDKLVVIQNTDGHLIWRIDQFDKRFKESQETEVMLKSPLFCDKPFGYTLRLEVSLNGIGTWRGRNLIVGLIVVSGYYDNLLEWPCTIRGTVTLRDQPEDRSTGVVVVDFSKGIFARRKNQHYEKNQYVHIPHQVLRSEHYIRDDSIFLEVRIDRQ